jgi:hypothetical protein
LDPTLLQLNVFGATVYEPIAQLSVLPPLTSEPLILAEPLLSSSTVTDWQTATGNWLSLTVTVKLQLLVFPLKSVATLFTVVVPTTNVLPEEGVDTTVNPKQLSVAVTANVTTALQLFGSLLCVIFVGHVITGF